MKHLYLMAWMLLIAGQLPAQMGEVRVEFRLLYGGEEIEAGKSYFYVKGGDSIVFENIRFYVSDLECSLGGVPVSLEKPAPRLVDLRLPASRIAILKVTPGMRPDGIAFHLGLDSLTNVSGAMGGDLDPTRGMYWAWQSGYVNFKLEGEYPGCPSRHHAFQFHLGGYLPPHATLQTVSLRGTPADHFRVDIAIDAFLSRIDLGETYQVMSPGAKAVELSRLLPGAFSIKE